jgi:hypothetical protein
MIKLFGLILMTESELREQIKNTYINPHPTSERDYWCSSEDSTVIPFDEYLGKVKGNDEPPDNDFAS